MKVNLNVPLVALDGEVVEQDKKIIILNTLCINALLQSEDPANKFKCFTLATKLNNATGGGIEITTEEGAFIKEIINKSQYTPLVVGRVFEAIEGNTTIIEG